MKILKTIGLVCLILIFLPFVVAWWKRDISDIELFLILFVGGSVILFGLAFVKTIFDSLKRKYTLRGKR